MSAGLPKPLATAAAAGPRRLRDAIATWIAPRRAGARPGLRRRQPARLPRARARGGGLRHRDRRRRRARHACGNGVNVLQSDLESGLAGFDDASFDCVILSQTLQAMRHTEEHRRRDAARRPRRHRHVPQLRPLDASAADPARPHAGVDGAALPVVRHAEHPPVHGRRLRRLPGASAAARSRTASCSPAGGAVTRAAQSARRARDLPLPRAAEPAPRERCSGVHRNRLRRAKPAPCHPPRRCCRTSCSGSGCCISRKGFPLGVFYEIFPVYFRQQGVELRADRRALAARARVDAQVPLGAGDRPLPPSSPLDGRGGRRAWAWRCCTSRCRPGFGPMVWLAIGVFTVLSATNDIAIDGYTIEFLDQRRARARQRHPHRPVSRRHARVGRSC